MIKEKVTRRMMAGNIPVYCAFDEIVPVEDLKPNPKNPNQHPERQVELLARIIEAQGWRQAVKVSTRSGLIVSGHGRYQAASLLGCPVPVDFQDYPSEAEELADLLADNRIAELSNIEKSALAEIFAEITAEDIDASLTGYSMGDIDFIMSELSESITEDDLDSFFVDAEPKEKQPKRIQCPHCGEWIEK